MHTQQTDQSHGTITATFSTRALRKIVFKIYNGVLFNQIFGKSLQEHVNLLSDLPSQYKRGTLSNCSSCCEMPMKCSVLTRISELLYLKSGLHFDRSVRRHAIDCRYFTILPSLSLQTYCTSISVTNFELPTTLRFDTDHKM